MLMLWRIQLLAPKGSQAQYTIWEPSMFIML
jgi:hypothetical protein